MFIPIRPMLSGKMNVNQIKNMILNCESGVLVETKYDGERI
jgi:ATP-dependent DNA ligase